MYTRQQKKAVTVDKKPDTGKKGEKQVADVKQKPAEKPALTKQATPPSAASSSDMSQVTTFINMLLHDGTVVYMKSLLFSGY